MNGLLYPIVNKLFSPRESFFERHECSFVALDDIITQIFEKVSLEGLISFEEAKQIFIRLNHNLNRKLNESEIQDLFCREVASKDENWMNLEEFKTLFLSFQF